MTLKASPGPFNRPGVSVLGHAILGLLTRSPHTGYQLAQLLKAPIGYMWTANHSQIYPELAKLQADGWVRSKVIDGPGPRDSKRYTLTAAGRRELQQWLDSPLSEPRRSEFMLRIRFLWLLPRPRAVAFVERERAKHLLTLEQHRAEEEDFDNQAGDIADTTSAGFVEYATLRFGMSRVQQTIDWCDWLLAQLTPHADPDQPRFRHPPALGVGASTRTPPVRPRAGA